jgi:hypothetical protein
LFLVGDTAKVGRGRGTGEVSMFEDRMNQAQERIFNRVCLWIGVRSRAIFGWPASAVANRDMVLGFAIIVALGLIGSALYWG